MLEKATPLASRATDDFVPRFQRYHQEHLVSGPLSAMREMISLQAYGMTISADQYSKPTCYWSEDLTKLYYKQHVIRMEMLRGMCATVVLETQNELVEHLVAQNLTYLDTRDPSRFRDSLTWATNDHCFADRDAENSNPQPTSKLSPLCNLSKGRRSVTLRNAD